MKKTHVIMRWKGTATGWTMNRLSGLEINGCPRHRDFAPGIEIFEVQCPAGTGQKRFSSSPDIYAGTGILGRAPKIFINLGARQAPVKKRLSSSPGLCNTLANLELLTLLCSVSSLDLEELSVMFSILKKFTRVLFQIQSTKFYENEMKLLSVLFFLSEEMKWNTVIKTVLLQPPSFWMMTSSLCW